MNLPHELLPVDVDGLRASCEELDQWRERLGYRGALSRRWAGRLRRELEAQAIGSSLAMEQIPVTIDQVRRVLAGVATPEVHPGDVDLVNGYRDAMEFVLRRADEPRFRWTREIITGVHDRVLAGNWAAGAGRLREGPVYVVSASSGELRFSPPPASDVDGLLDDACQIAAEADWHPAILSGWLHVAVAAIHPFADGNGRTARIVASLAMYRGGFRLKEFTSLEEWWGRNRDDYYAAFACLGPIFDRGADVTAFVAAHIRAQISQSAALHLREAVERDVWAALENVAVDHHLPERVTHALWDAFFLRDTAAPYYRELADISPASARIDLAGAAHAGLLRPDGERRFRRYLPGPRLHAAVAAELGVDAPHPAEPARDLIIAELTRRIGLG